MAEPRLREKTWEAAYEEEILALWHHQPELYAFDPKSGEPVFIIDTPPPYPSGSWHVGAVMAYSMIDMVARAQRMAGKAVRGQQHVLPLYLDAQEIGRWPTT